MTKELLQVFIDLKWLKIWVNDLKERNFSKMEIDKRENLIEFKRDIRRRLKLYTPEEDVCYRIYPKEDFESFTDVYLVPRTKSESRQDFEDWFWECRALSIRGYDYSPTGLLFTSSVRFAKQTLPNGKLVWRVHETLRRDV